LEDAVTHVQSIVPVRLEAMAREAGADHVEVNMARQDHIVPDIEGTEEGVYLSTELTFVATGRPSLARER
jgi:hypothetical protein